MIYLGFVYSLIGMPGEAESLAHLRCGRQPSPPRRRTPHDPVWDEHLGCCYANQCRMTEAESLLRKSYDISRRVLGEERLETIFAMSNLGMRVLVAGQTDGGRAPDHRSRWRSAAAVLGDEHGFTQGTLWPLGTLYRVQGKYAAGRVALRPNAWTRAAGCGGRGFITLMHLTELVRVYTLEGKFSLAQGLLERRLEESASARGARDYGTTIAAMNDLAGFLASTPGSSRSQNAARAVELAKKAVAAFPRSLTS